ncbi:type III secretion system stator protein SctL [Robbsia andropogonis]|uniref:type III secretion system stator protein SctL n=1 Tax=Robbsia andropogonis TaxID=28092 RepID=UPI00209D9252|nr:type III secretion system stator protein SctL [Robbsia andropogonis]MCP1118208.1 type III secretion system stator protein SctL [Robbsia andropogonis]MCP1127511.1 type III secretion system stator protein SctL [Robbsia andropogonis]
MVIWLRKPSGGIAVGQDVLRASELAQLVELDRASVHFERCTEELLSAARRDAQAIHSAAEEESQRTLRAAQTKYENAARLGYEAGRRRAMQEAHATMLRRAKAERDVLVASRQRIAGLIMRTVTKVVGETERDALFTQVAVSLSRSLEDTSFLTVRVAECDIREATHAFRNVCEANGWPVNPEILVDPEAEPGSCVCEWDHGVIEGGLPMQLRAIAAAIRRVTSAEPASSESADTYQEGLVPEGDIDDTLPDNAVDVTRVNP